MLAQITQPGFWPVMEHLGLLAAMLGNVALVVALRRRKEVRRIEPQPFDVRLIHDMAREKDCMDRHKVSLEQITELRGARTEDARAASISRKAIYEEIKRTELRLSDKIDTMPDRIIATLRNFGAIGEKHR